MKTLNWAWCKIQNIIMWLSLNVKSNSKSFKINLAENFLYNWSESEKIKTSKQDDCYKRIKTEQGWSFNQFAVHASKYSA